MQWETRPGKLGVEAVERILSGDRPLKVFAEQRLRHVERTRERKHEGLPPPARFPVYSIWLDAVRRTAVQELYAQSLVGRAPFSRRTFEDGDFALHVN